MDWGVGLQGWVGGLVTPRLGLTAAVVGYSEVGVEEDIFEVYLCVGTWLDDDIADDSEVLSTLSVTNGDELSIFKY